MIYLAINGRKPYDILVDIVDGRKGATIKHIYASIASIDAAERIIDRIIACDSLMLASLGLPIAEYTKVIHAAERAYAELLD